MASRVLPIPPGPIKVNSRHAGSAKRSVISATSSARPMKDVGCGGRWYVPVLCFDDCCIIISQLAVAANQQRAESV